MGGSTRQTTNSTQTTLLPQNQQQNVNTLMSGIQDLWKSGGPQYFAGQNFTMPTQRQLLGREMMTNYATGQGQEFANAATGAGQFWLDPSRVYDLNSVPGYGGMRQGIVDLVNQNLMENMLPQTRSTAIAGGALGGSRQGMMDALAVGRSSGELGRALADLDYNTSGRNLQAQQTAMQLAPSLFQLGAQPGGMVDAVGGAERADSQEQLQAEMERWNFDENKLQNLLAVIQALTGTAGQYGGTVKGKQTTSQSGGGLQQALGLAMSLGGMLMGGPAGAAAAGLGTGTAGVPFSSSAWNNFGANLARPFGT